MNFGNSLPAAGGEAQSAAAQGNSAIVLAQGPLRAKVSALTTAVDSASASTPYQVAAGVMDHAVGHMCSLPAAVDLALADLDSNRGAENHRANVRLRRSGHIDSIVTTSQLLLLDSAFDRLARPSKHVRTWTTCASAQVVIKSCVPNAML